MVVGTRGSKLALAQTRSVIRRLAEAWPGVTFEERIVRTVGDAHADVSLTRLVADQSRGGGRGLFTKAIEDRLLSGEVDIAVHSAKDLPTGLAQGLRICAFARREDARDALVLREAADALDARGAEGDLSVLRENAIIGTSSPRRRAQLAHKRPDLRFVELRGNLDTRLRRLRERGLDAIVVAMAGLNRLGVEGLPLVTLPFDVCLPAAGQGALAIEVRSGDVRAAELVGPLDDRRTAAAVRAERAALAALQGGCTVPVGIHGAVEGCNLRLAAVLASPDGTAAVRCETAGDADHPEEVGSRLAAELLGAGGEEVLQRL